MAFMRLENVLPPLILCAVITTYLKPTSSQRTTTITFAAIPDPINVLKNETVEFICEQNANNTFNIKYKGNIVIVENKQIKDEFLDIFDFQMLNSTTGKLTLKQATEEYTKYTYKCGDGADEKYAVIGNVYTLISSKPICKSSIEIGPYIFEDQIDLIEINCTSEDEVPHVTMSNYIILRNKTTDVTSISTKTTSSHPHPSKTISFSTYFNSSFNNSVFVCNVSQQLPAPYNQSYQGSCSFGPILFHPLFSVTANPSIVNFSDVRNVVLRCTSNVSEVNLTWTNIPSHWRYDIIEGDTYIELIFTDTGSDVYSVDIQCVGYYGDRVITTTAHISYSPLSFQVTNLAIYLTLVIIIVVVCVAVVFLLRRVYVTNSQQKKDTTQIYYASVDLLPGILPTENHVNINSSSFTYDSGGYLSPCEPLQDDEQYDIVK
ncbi:uncharacterized protein [Apostichopus japonicus]|uniref:uncharacterized protein n=1 Tax=Stichopus japonicus TaxID=307972 RepID=UPI003AB7C818